MGVFHVFLIVQMVPNRAMQQLSLKVAVIFVSLRRKKNGVLPSVFTTQNIIFTIKDFCVNVEKYSGFCEFVYIY